MPNFAQLKRSDPAHVLPGYDYDVVTEEVVLTRMAVRDGRIVLPDGMSYRVLVLPDRPSISLAVLRKVGRVGPGRCHRDRRESAVANHWAGAVPFM